MHSTGPRGFDYMPKRKSKPRSGQAKGKPPRTAAQYHARSARQRSLIAKTAHVLAAMRTEGLSLSKAARENQITPKAVRHHAGAALRKTPRGTYKARASDKMLRVLVIPAPGELREVATRDSRMATILGQYANAVQTFLQTGDATELQRFQRRYVIDAEGNSVALLTDLDELERLGAAGVLSFESLYARAS